MDKQEEELSSFEQVQNAFESSGVATPAMGAPSSSAVIAKLLSTLASHGAAPFFPLHPILAFGALLKLGSLHEIDKLLIVFVETVTDPVLGTTHPMVILAPASETVMFFAGRAAVVVESCIELEHAGAACSGAPRHVACISFHILVKTVLFILLAEVPIDKLMNVTGCHFHLAGLHRTPDFYIAGLDLGLEEAIQALGVEDVSALEDAHKGGVDFAKTDLALPPLFFLLLCFPLHFHFFFLEHFHHQPLVVFEFCLLLPLLKNVSFVFEGARQVSVHHCKQSLLSPRFTTLPFSAPLFYFIDQVTGDHHYIFCFQLVINRVLFLHGGELESQIAD